MAVHVGRQYSVKVVPLELIELGKTGQCIQKRVCAFRVDRTEKVYRCF